MAGKMHSDLAKELAHVSRALADLRTDFRRELDSESEARSGGLRNESAERQRLGQMHADFAKELTHVGRGLAELRTDFRLELEAECEARAGEISLLRSELEKA